MVWKCKHGIVTVEKYCADCHKKPSTYSPGQTLGNRKPVIMKMEKR